MKTLLSSLLLIFVSSIATPAYAQYQAYKACVETCNAWTGKADPQDIKQCIESYCRRYLLDEILKKASFADSEVTPWTSQEEQEL